MIWYYKWKIEKKKNAGKTIMGKGERERWGLKREETRVEIGKKRGSEWVVNGWLFLKGQEEAQIDIYIYWYIDILI